MEDIGQTEFRLGARVKQAAAAGGDGGDGDGTLTLFHRLMPSKSMSLNPTVTL